MEGKKKNVSEREGGGGGGKRRDGRSRGKRASRRCVTPKNRRR